MLDITDRDRQTLLDAYEWLSTLVADEARQSSGFERPWGWERMEATLLGYDALLTRWGTPHDPAKTWDEMES